MYVVGVISQFIHAPTQAHMYAAYRMLRYLKSCPCKGLLYHGNHRMVAYIDVDWASSISDIRLTSGYYTFVGGNLVTWLSKKESVVARSSAAVEFRSMMHDICEFL